MEDIESEVILDTDVIIDYLKRNPDPRLQKCVPARAKNSSGVPPKISQNCDIFSMPLKIAATKATKVIITKTRKTLKHPKKIQKNLISKTMILTLDINSTLGKDDHIEM